MDKKKRITTLIVAMAMFCMMSMSTLAVSNKVVSLPKDQKWTSSYIITRASTDYSFIYASCDSVYPTDGSSDNFKKIQARLVDVYGNLMLDENVEFEVLEEGKGYTKLYIKDGHLTLNPIYIQFRGNTSAAAEAVVNYFGL